jgi:hypothetical protein
MFFSQLRALVRNLLTRMLDGPPPAGVPRQTEQTPRFFPHVGDDGKSTAKRERGVKTHQEEIERDTIRAKPFVSYLERYGASLEKIGANFLQRTRAPARAPGFRRDKSLVRGCAYFFGHRTHDRTRPLSCCVLVGSGRVRNLSCSLPLRLRRRAQRALQ